MGYTLEGTQAQVEENLAKSIQGIFKGRGLAKCDLSPGLCLCRREYTDIICQNCGHLMFGRVRLQCPKHPMVTFLIDISHCPRCKCLAHMLYECENLEDEEDEDL